MAAPAEVSPPEERRRWWRRASPVERPIEATEIPAPVADAGRSDAAAEDVAVPPTPIHEPGRPARLVKAVVRHGATILHVASLIGAFVVLLVVDRQMWFRVDDFEFLAKRGLHGATYSIWFPHNEHWSTLPVLAYRALSPSTDSAPPPRTWCSSLPPTSRSPTCCGAR